MEGGERRTFNFFHGHERIEEKNCLSLHIYVVCVYVYDVHRRSFETFFEAKEMQEKHMEGKRDRGEKEGKVSL